MHFSETRNSLFVPSGYSISVLINLEFPIPISVYIFNWLFFILIVPSIIFPVVSFRFPTQVNIFESVKIKDEAIDETRALLKKETMMSIEFGPVVSALYALLLSQLPGKIASRPDLTSKELTVI